VSLTCMPITAEMAEKWGLVNHIVDDTQVLSKAIEVCEAIARNNRNLVVLYKSVINDGLQLDLEHARALEKVCTYTMWCLNYLTSSRAWQNLTTN
jgi:enoyl-CoA hydratase